MLGRQRGVLSFHVLRLLFQILTYTCLAIFAIPLTSISSSVLKVIFSIAVIFVLGQLSPQTSVAPP